MLADRSLRPSFFEAVRYPASFQSRNPKGAVGPSHYLPTTRTWKLSGRTGGRPFF
jgi:hypothetical protein